LPKKEKKMVINRDITMAKYAKKSLGQHFLTQPNAINRIIEKSGIDEDDVIVELGIGRGALTYNLSKIAKKVIGVELDKELIDWLNEQGIPENLKILHEDMLRLNFKKLAEKEGKKLKLIGNLPYYLSTQMIFRLIKFREHIDWAVLMFQKEVAKRLTAKHGSKDYGIPTVILNYYADIEPIMDLSPKNFSPPPKVYSTVVKIIFRKPHLELLDENIFISLVKRGFSKRRKTLENNLTGFKKLKKTEIKNILETCGINNKARAENLSCKDFVNIANEITRVLKNNQPVS